MELFFAYNERHSLDGSGAGDQSQVKFGLPMKKIMRKALNRTLSSVEGRLKLLLEDEHAKSLTKSEFFS